MKKITSYFKGHFLNTFLIFGIILLATTASRVSSAEPAPLSVLFLDDPSPYSDQSLDKQYVEQLAAAGIQYATVDYYTPLPDAFLKRFNVFVLSHLPIDNFEDDTFGLSSKEFHPNLNRVLEAVKNGAGLLIYSDLMDAGGWHAGRWNEVMRPFGASLRQACVVDPAHTALEWKGGNDVSRYCWTENVAQHPSTDGVRRFYYPAATLRWDDSYSTPALKFDSSWTILVRAMKGSRIGRQEEYQWVYDPEQSGEMPPPLVAVRSWGKGRIATIAMPANYTHRMGYHKISQAGGWFGEMCLGLVDGIILEKGDGKVPSDTGRLLTNLYRWLGADSVPAGFGGFKSGEPVPQKVDVFKEIVGDQSLEIDWDHYQPPRSWAHLSVPFKVGNDTFGKEVTDPRVKGEIRFFKALIGARTSLSDGQGSVAEYAQAARTAGYSLVCFTETFERIDNRKWDLLVEECHKNSVEDLILLPGLDMMDRDGNRYLFVRPNYFPYPSWMTPDGKRLVRVQLTNPLTFGNCLAIAHRSHTSPLPTERLKHFSGFSVITYRGDQVADDSRQEYAWHVANADLPLPVVVHEVYSPAEVAIAARTGFQQLLPADNLRAGVDYFRSGMYQYFKHPARYLISGGPIIERWTIDPGWRYNGTDGKGAGGRGHQQCRVWIKVTGDEPLATVTLYDGFTPVRRWKTDAKSFEATADFPHSQQRHFYLVAQDSKGREAITSSCRTVLPRNVFRCADHQNWIGHVDVQYTGLKISDQTDIKLPVKGTAEGAGLLPNSPGDCMATKLQFPFTSEEVVLGEAILDEKYLTATFKEIGADGHPSLPSKTSTLYCGRFRRWNFTGYAPDQPYPTVLEHEIRLRHDVEPRDPRGLFPSFSALRSKKRAWLDKSGNFQSDTFSPDQSWDVPVGALAGGYIPLSEGFRVEGDFIGLKPPLDVPFWLPAGTTWSSRMLLSGMQYANRGFETKIDEAPEKWLRALGFQSSLPFRLKIRRGRLEKIAFTAKLTAEDGVVSGEVKTEGDIPYPLPLQICGINSQWPAALWRPNEGIRYIGIFENQAWGSLDVRQKGLFIVGNLIVADHRLIALGIVHWTRDRIRLEVHNPTDDSVTTRVRTPVKIPDLKSFDREMTIPAGSTVYVE
jgi:hypothetical protein